MPAVNLPNVLRQHAGGERSVEVEGETIGEVLHILQRRYPTMAGQLIASDGHLHRFVNVYLNDDDVRYLERLDTKVSADDNVTILPAVAGGGV